MSEERAAYVTELTDAEVLTLWYEADPSTDQHKAMIYEFESETYPMVTLSRLVQAAYRAGAKQAGERWVRERGGV